MSSSTTTAATTSGDEEGGVDDSTVAVEEHEDQEAPPPTPMEQEEPGGGAITNNKKELSSGDTSGKKIKEAINDDHKHCELCRSSRSMFVEQGLSSQKPWQLSFIFTLCRAGLKDVDGNSIIALPQIPLTIIKVPGVCHAKGKWFLLQK
jgi:hypothetical protein